MNDAASLFEFELDFAGSLHCIPMCVRFKLDCCGIKLSLKQWNHFSLYDRERLIGLSSETDGEIVAYRMCVVKLIEADGINQLKELPLPLDPEWNRLDRLPSQLVAWSTGKGVSPPSLSQWQALTPLKRFVLLKLSHPEHENRNFLPALREFGLLN
jgi:hypothetical protein